MIQAHQILPGDRISVSAHNRSVQRTVIAVGDNYAVIQVCGQIAKVPEHKILSHIACGDETRGGRYGV